ncbi:hypothetical protein NA78x_000759 [Anatilimnocola sp. NA78]|uniref:GspE/PulE/PilB domain-containing protein n=1 Tax=Anatilimnocola sp. NA78 TaxID=3415683 RepID=UPI003CE59CE4
MSADDSIPSISPSIIELVPESVARECCVLPAAADKASITLYCPDEPGFAAANFEKLRFILKMQVQFIPAERQAILQAIDRHYSQCDYIDGCELAFRFRCPRTWESLSLTKDEAIRHCPECEQLVYLCESLEQAEALGAQRKCIAYGGWLGDVQID